MIGAALALGRFTGLTGKDEVIRLRACLIACTQLMGRPEGGDGTSLDPRGPWYLRGVPDYGLPLVSASPRS